MLLVLGGCMEENRKETFEYSNLVDNPIRNEMKTQKWQLPYFVDMSDPSKLPIGKIIELYSL